MKASLLENCGQDWFNRRVAGAWFVHKGQVATVVRAVGGTIYVHDAKRNMKELKPEEIPGFRSFTYPKLGYRRDDRTGAVGFLTKFHTYDRGLRPKNLKVETSPAYQAVHRAFQLHEVDEVKFMESVLLPKFEDINLIPDLLEAKRFALVPNADVLIEPSVVEGAEDLVVYYRQRPAAHINVKGKIAFRNESYKTLLAPMFKNVLKV